MSVVSVNEWRMPEATFKADGDREYKRFFMVRTSSQDDGPLTVALANDLPRVGEIYRYPGTVTTPGPTFTEYDEGVYAQSMTPKLADKNSKTLWSIEVPYTSVPTSKQTGNNEQDPLNEPPKFSGSFLRVTEIFEEDKDGNAILMSSGEPPDPPLEEGVSYPTLRIEMNVATPALALWADYANATNSSSFWGLGPRQWAVEKIDWQDQFRGNGSRYVTVSFEFAAKYNTWDRKFLDRGYYRKVVAPIAGKILITDVDGQPVNAPRLLDGSGNVLEEGATPVYITKVLRPSRAFAALGVPSSYPS